MACLVRMRWPIAVMPSPTPFILTVVLADDGPLSFPNKVLEQACHDSLSAPPVTEGVCPAPVPVQHLFNSLQDSVRARASQDVTTNPQRLRSFGVVPQSNTRYPQNTALFLDTAGVGEDRCGICLQREEITRSAPSWISEINRGISSGLC